MTDASEVSFLLHLHNLFFLESQINKKIDQLRELNLSKAKNFNDFESYLLKSIPFIHSVKSK